ncbi:MAG: hypothetical protein M3400_07895 [Actinomycetota bacterium]|nr:hypothetical protein [Actinomycetota bacterium]
MTRPRGIRTIAWLLAAAMGAALGVGPLPQAAATTAVPEISAARVVILAVPGLLWGDVASGLAPGLTELASDAALGNMTVRAARSRTCILDGLATLGAGNRARYPAPTEEAEEHLPPLTPEEAQRMALLAGCGQQEQVALAGLTDVTQTIGRIAEDEGTRAFGAQPGALGAAVSCSTAIGRTSAVALAAPTAQVSILDVLPPGRAQIAAALSRCPLSVITVPDLIGSVPTVTRSPPTPGADRQQDRAAGPLAGMLGRPRAQALAAADSAITDVAATIAALPGKTLLLVAGVSEKGVSRAQLHPLIAVHPELPSGYLTSASTGRTPYVQLIDVAPTALRSLGVANAESMVGSAIQWAQPSDGLESALVTLRDQNRAAVAHSSLTRTFFWSLVFLGGAFVAGLGWARLRKSTRIVKAVSVAGLAFAALPAATELANLTPWWRSPTRELALGLSLAGYIAVLTLLSLILGARHGPISKLLPPGRAWSGPALVILLATALTVGIDVMLGSPMEFNSLVGYNAIVAGRFVGLGNLTFGLFAVSVLLATAVLVRGSIRQTLLAGGAVGVTAVILVGAADLGRDFGGVLALVPGFLLLGFLVTGTRLSLRRVATIAMVTAAAVSTFALLDYQRDPDDRTHLGRFVAQLIDGQAFTVVSRKAQANLDVLTGSPVTWLIPIFAVAVFLMVWRAGRLPGVMAAEPGWRAGVVAALVSLVIAAVINDSGVAVPAIAGCVLIPVLVWLTVHGGSAADTMRVDEVPDTPIARDASTPSRVSVNSREPTG